ncbi:ankyrin repeat domain-containing protein [Marinobacteraceae bacterium S3BR75-40.1]
MKLRFSLRLSLLLVLVALFTSGCGTTPVVANVENKQVESPTPLIDAAKAGNVEQIHSLVETGGSVNAQAPGGTPLLAAVRQGNERAALALLRYGANPDLGDDQGTTPLMVAAKNGNATLARYLLAGQASVNQANAEGDTPVSLAARAGNLALVKLLLNAGGNVNIEQAGRSLLMQVVGNNDLLMAQVLIDAGADVHYVSPNGKTALDVARSQGNRDLEMLLIQSGAQG